ncbi:MAG: FecR family protein, partial [Anaerolineae bacterium]|nr:FecR family protein [Anaerolineae bacterium]
VWRSDHAEVVQRAQALYRPRPRHVAFGLPSLTAFLAGLRQSWARAAALRYAAAIVAAALFILGGTWWAWGSTAVAETATLTDVQGPVEVRLTPDGEWQPALPGMMLTAGSALRSGAGASATLLYPDGSRTQLTENVQLEILSLQRRRNQQATTVRLSQTTGLTHHEMATDKSSVRVEVDGAAAQARKGGFEVRVTKGAFEVHAARGSVDVQTGGKTMHLSQGERGQVKGRRLTVTPAESRGDDPPSDRSDRSEDPSAGPQDAHGRAQPPDHPAPSSRGGPPPQPPAGPRGPEQTSPPLPPAQDVEPLTREEGQDSGDARPSAGVPDGATNRLETPGQDLSPEQPRKETSGAQRAGTGPGSAQGWAFGARWRADRIRPAWPPSR